MRFASIWRADSKLFAGAAPNSVSRNKLLRGCKEMMDSAESENLGFHWVFEGPRAGAKPDFAGIKQILHPTRAQAGKTHF